MNIIKRIKYYNLYKSVLKKHRYDLQEKFNIKIDDLYRMYTVYHIEEEEYRKYGIRAEQQFNFSSPEATIQIANALNELTMNEGSLVTGDDALMGIVNANIERLDKYLISIGLTELYGITDISKIENDFNVSVIIEYKYLNMRLLANMMVAIILGIIGFGMIGIVLGIMKFFI